MAEVTIEQALQIALQQHRAGNVQQAEAVYRQVLSQNPNHPEALQLLGVIEFENKQYEAAIELLTRAISVQPTVSHYHNNLGSAFLAIGRKDEAIAAYQRSIALDPNSFDARRNLADVVSDLGRFDEAIEHYRHAARLQPTRFDVLNNLGQTLHSAGQYDEAAKWYREALRVRPDLAEAHGNLGGVLLETGHASEAIECYRTTIRLRPQFAAAHSNLIYALHFDPELDRETIFKEHLNWAAIHAAPLAGTIQPHPNDRDPDRRLRIGYVSQDFRDHPVGRFMLPILEHHDRASFELHLFSDVLIEDAVTRAAKAQASQWHVIEGKKDVDVAQLVREQQIDILVDLAGHVGVSRLLAFARRPAPVQVTYLGYPDTTGMTALDYRFTDALADPAGTADVFYTEKLIRLPHGFLCHQPVDLPEIAPSPAARNGFVTFGSFNNFAKVSADAIRLWAKVLDAVPRSRLLIKALAMGDEQTRENARRRLIEHGIPADRLDVRGRTASYREHLAAYDAVDVALDTIPYNGTTTTLEALAMGVPVVALVGNSHAGRVGLSILTHGGFEQRVAKTPGDYVEIAAKLAAGLPSRAEVRKQLMSSPLADGARLTRDIESAYRQIWRTWCLTKAV